MICFGQASESGVREAILTALKGVVKYAGKSVSSAVRTRVYTLLKELIYSEDDQIRLSAASTLGMVSQVCHATQTTTFLTIIFNVLFKFCMHDMQYMTI